MAEMYRWIRFRAHPGEFNEEEDSHPDFFGIFVSQDQRREPEQLLRELLSNRKLSLIDISGTQLMSGADDWGMNERLKRDVGEQGYGISLVKLHAAPSEWD